MSEPTLQQEIEALRPATEGTLQQMAKGIPLMGRGPDGKAKIINVDENGNVKVQQSGTIATLSTDPAPEGSEGMTWLQHNPTTGETKVFKYISGDWREL